jgi:sporulation related protein
MPNPVRLLAYWRKLFWLGVSAVVVMAGDMLLVTYGPALRAASVETGASFSVSAGSFATEAKAATFAAALDASGLPILVRVRPDDGRYQVLVGPYVSTEEAERAQRRMAAWGLGEARLVVDDTMRSNPQEASVFGFGRSEGTSVVMVAAAGMSSIVFEMSRAPKQVEARRSGSTSLDVEIGQQTAGSRHRAASGAQRAAGSGQSAVGSGQSAAAGSAPAAGAFEPLRLPDGVSLVRELSVQTTDGDATRAHVVVPVGVESRVRLEGRRVYVDLAFPKAPWVIVKPAPQGPGLPRNESPRAGRVQADPEERVGRVVLAPTNAYREQVDAIVARFTEIEPFLLSAAQAPEPDVLAALAHSLEDVRASLERTTAPADQRDDRQALLLALARAQAALAPTFASNRKAAVEEAVALFHSH